MGLKTQREHEAMSAWASVDTVQGYHDGNPSVHNTDRSDKQPVNFKGHPIKRSITKERPDALHPGFNFSHLMAPFSSFEMGPVEPFSSAIALPTSPFSATATLEAKLFNLSLVHKRQRT